MGVYFDWHYLFNTFISGLSEQEKLSVSDVLSTSGVHLETLANLLSDHAQQSARIEEHAVDTFREKYMVCYFTSIDTNCGLLLVYSHFTLCSSCFWLILHSVPSFNTFHICWSILLILDVWFFRGFLMEFVLLMVGLWGHGHDACEKRGRYSEQGDDRVTSSSAYGGLTGRVQRKSPLWMF